MRNNKFFHILIVLLTFVSNVFSQSTKSNEYSYIIGQSAKCAWVGDTDIDGDNDLIVGHSIGWNGNEPLSYTLTIFRNINGTDIQIVDTSYRYVSGNKNIFAIDMDKNGYPDIVSFYGKWTNNICNQYIRIFYNTNGNYDSYIDYWFTSNLSAERTIEYGDFNGDGYQDLLLYTVGYDNYMYIYNDGHGGLRSPVSLQFWGDTTGEMSVADFDNDGFSDFVVSGRFVEIWFGKQIGFDVIRIEADSIHEFLGDIAIADFDGDGDKDIFLCASLGVTAYRFYENTGNRNFIVHPMLWLDIAIGHIKVFDINNDGLPDLVSPNLIEIGYYINNGDFSLAQRKMIPYPAPAFAAERYSDIGDLDGNALTDLVIINYTTYDDSTFSTVDILYNDGNSNFRAAPFVPVIEKFTVIDTLLSTSVIDQVNGTINIQVPYGTDITQLVPEISVPYNAQTTPAIGDPVDFSQAVDYEVIFPSWGRKTYRVSVTIDSASVELKSFRFDNLQSTDSISQKNNTVTVIVPEGTDMSNLIPTIVVADSATVSPPSCASNDFTHNQVYTVTNRLGIQRNYTITVKPNVGIDDLKAQTEFKVFPNFFTDNFRVKYHLFHTSNVNISLYNAKGQCITRIIDKQQRSGDYNLLVTASQLISGEIYFIKLSINNQIIATEKLVKK